MVSGFLFLNFLQKTFSFSEYFQIPAMQPHQASPNQRILTFGSFQTVHAHERFAINGEKSRSLLAYLVLHPGIMHRREILADLLWPDAAPDRVRRNLSDVIYRLQKAVDPDWLIVEADAIAFQPHEDVWVDVWEFDKLVASREAEKLQTAVETYLGDLLPDIFDDWIIPERELRRSQYLSALESLTRVHEARGNLQQALLFTRKLVLAEPLHEPAHQAYIRLLGRLGRFGEAIAHYAFLRTLLRSELDTEPMAETRAIIQSLERERDLESIQSQVEEKKPFIGRKTERAAALSVVEKMLNGTGGLMAIEGEAGIGKSRFLREIAAGARWRGATVLMGQASVSPSASPFSPLTEALIPFINSPGGQQLETLLAGETLAALAPLHPEWRGKAELYLVPPDQAGNRFRIALRAFGELLAKLTPVVLVFDDLHWADPVLWECLSDLSLGFVRSGGLMVLSYRRPEIEKMPGWRFIQEWDRDRQLKIISLEPLSVEEVTEFIGEKGLVNPVELRAWTGGNPFFITEWLAGPESGSTSKYSTLNIRLQSISPTVKAALECASILGERISYRLWTGISDLSPLDLAGHAEDLVAHRLLEPSATGYAFEHELIRTAVYDAMEPVRRRNLHERAAHAYLIFEPENLRARAYHLDQAGLFTDAATAYRLEGEQEVACFAYREAQAAFDRALALTPALPTTERIETVLALAQVCDSTGDRVRQKSALDEALTLASENNPLRLQALLAGGRFATHTGKVDAAGQHLKAALALARQLNDKGREIEATIQFANLAIEQGNWNEAQKWSLLALEQARAAGDKPAEGRALRYMGITARTIGQPEKSIKWLEEAIAVQRALGDRLQVSITQTNLLPAFNELGNWDRSITTAEELVPIKDSLGDRLGATIARQNQSLAYYAIGEYTTARQILERVIKDSEAVQSRRRAGLARNVLGLVAEAEGKEDEAIVLYRAALADAEAVKAQTEAAYARHDLGALLIRLGQPSEAIVLLDAASATWTRQGNLFLRVKSETFLGLAFLSAGDRERAGKLATDMWAAFQRGVPTGEQPQDWHWALYHLLIALDQPEQARAVLQAAYYELQRQSQYIAEPELRRGFFENVRTNREIVAAHDRLSGNPRKISVALARKDVPLGRSLRDDEYVTFHWTVNAPQDETISDKSFRRQYRLKRLLQEAGEQDAAPTDDDLARALGVSRRTILRDIQFLSREIPAPPTRKRKK